MTAQDIIRQLQTLDVEEVSKVRDWLDAHDEESEALLAAIDAGARSLEEGRTAEFTREELQARVRAWAGASS